MKTCGRECNPQIARRQYLILEAEDEGLEVDVHQLAQRILSHIGKCGRREDSRVVEGHVQPTERLDRGIYHAFAVGFLKCATARNAELVGKRNAHISILIGERHFNDSLRRNR